MSDSGYQQLTVKAPAAWEEPLTMLLFDYGAPGVAVDDPAIIARHLSAGDWDASVFDGQDIAVGQVTLSAVFPVDMPLDALCGEIAARCPKSRLGVAPLPDTDWLQKWRESFPLLLLGEKLAVLPHWRREEAPPGRVTLFIDPGLAFGTGDHPTTALCAKLLEKYLRPGQAVLDLGSGSGILAIAAVKLGAGNVLAVDNDPDCGSSLARHCRLNKVEIPFICGDVLEKIDFPAHIVVSNIVAGVIARLAPVLPRQALWIASGILAEKEGLVLAACAEHGWRVTERRADGEWVALVMSKTGTF